MFYMAMFEIHFAILRNPGDGDAFMSSEFQHTLDGKGMQSTYAGSYSILSTTKDLISFLFF
jgi:dolichyl-phosphate-mannose-protein mannosyltransferase